MTATTPQSLPAEMVEVVVHAMEHAHPHVHLHLLVDLARRFDKDQLTAALHGLVAAFPVLGCRYEPGFWRDRWVPWGGDLAELCHVERPADLEAATIAWAQRPMPYLEEPTIRLAFFERADGEGGRLVMSIHHMTTDGGGMKAAGAVLCALLCRMEPDPPPNPNRSLLSAGAGLRLADLPILAWELIREGLMPLSMLRARALDHGTPTGSGTPSPHWTTVSMVGESYARLATNSKARSATINDALVATVARLAARRSDRGPVIVAYTVDLRRYLRQRSAQITNLAGVSMVVLARRATRSAGAAVDAVVSVIGTQKRRLAGLPYLLLPALSVGWLPHGLLRIAGAAIIGQILARFQRAIAVTNIGSLDATLAPFGDDALAASVTGPFIHGNPVPIITVTGFRGSLTLQVVSTQLHSRADLEAFAAELDELLQETAALA